MSLTGRRAVSIDSLGMLDSLSHTLEARRTEPQQTKYNWGSCISWPDMNLSRYLEVKQRLECYEDDHVMFPPHCKVDRLGCQAKPGADATCPLDQLSPSRMIILYRTGQAREV